MISAAIGTIVGALIASSVNKLVYGKGGTGSVTIFKCPLPFFMNSITYDIDVGEKLGSFLGGTGGVIAGVAAASAGLIAGLAG